MPNNQYLLIYVDDLLLITPSIASMNRRKNEISNVLNIKDLGEVSDYLGIHVKRKREEKVFLLSQGGLIDSIVKCVHPTKAYKIPASPSDDFFKESPKLDDHEHEVYRSVLGKLLYLARITRPDICLTVNFLGRFASSPTEHHMHLMRKLAGYLLESRDLVLKLSGSEEEMEITAHTDADWAGDTNDA